MAHYRLYFLDKDGHFARAEDLHAEDDRLALTCARDFDHPFGAEVWQQARKVGALEPTLAETS